MSRMLVDNRRYYLEGGQAGIETKRGCPMECVYCADPLAKGSSTRLRPPKDVVAELGRLLGQGIEHVHICDSEFNVPEDHALEICGEIIRRGLGDRLHWYAYCKPGPFSRELAGQMRRSDCRGINFGADSGDEGMLGRLGRDFGPEEILSAARSCRENGIAVMLDLLLGAPGETRESVARTVSAYDSLDRTNTGTGRSLFESLPENRVCDADGPIIGGSSDANRSLPPL
ncbi:MAG: radical SAM protein [Candidatus Deferrimicrobium sp.]